MSGVFQNNVKLALSASGGADIASYTPPPQSFIEIRSAAFSAVFRQKFHNCVIAEMCLRNGAVLLLYTN